MITCLGLVVGELKSCVRQFTLNECAKFIKEHSYLISSNHFDFEIDRQVYATVLDTYEENGKLYVYFRMYNGETSIGIA